MSNNRIRYDGLDELKAWLRALPATRTAEAAHTVQGAANASAVAIRTAYGAHSRSGNLQDGVEVEHTVSEFGVRSVVRSTSKHASIFENGTQARHTEIGANRGSMPPGNVVVPANIRFRGQMYEELKDQLRRDGFVVTGDA